MLYAFAVNVTTYTLGTNYSVYGGDYKTSTDSWFFVSSNNNTIIELDDNSTAFTSTTYNSGAGTCTDAHNIIVLKSQPINYLAMICNNGSAATLQLQIRKSVSPYELVDYESGFSNTEDVYNMAEWIAGDRLYLVNSGSGSPLIYQFNLNNINSTLSNMFVGSIAASSANTCWDITVSESRSQAYVACFDGGSDSGFSVIDLGTSTSSQFVELEANTGGGMGIDIFDGNDTLVITDVTVDDLWIYDLENVAITSHNTAVCTDPITPQFNENSRKIFVTCKGNNYIAIYNPTTDVVESTINVQTFDAGIPFGANNVPKFKWIDSQAAGYLAYGFLDPSHGAGVFNYVTRIEDTTSFTGETSSEFCQQPENFYILRCVLERGDTTPLMGASETIDESATNIICQIGLVQCVQNEDGSFTPVDDNIQTNGIGYIILVVALGILIGIFWVASRGDLGSIPTFLWFIATLAVIGTITAFEFIDPTFLVIAIIAIIALAVAKTKGLFGSSALFTGET